MARVWGSLYLKKYWRVLAAGVGGLLIGVVLASSLIYKSSPQVAGVTAPDNPVDDYPRRPLSWLKNTNIIPSFSCEHASTPVEIMICSSADLARLDYDLSDLYFSVRGTVASEDADNELKIQRAWLSRRDDECLYNEDLPGSEITDAVHIICLSDIYKARLTELSRKYVDGDDAPLRDYYADGPDNRTIFKGEPGPGPYMEGRSLDFRVVNDVLFLITKEKEVGSGDWEAKVTLDVLSRSEGLLETVEFGSTYYKFLDDDNLSEDIVVLKSHVGGASCCYIIHAFQTKPELRRLLEHDNDFFSSDIRLVSKDLIELYDGRSPEYSHPSKARASLVYNPIYFDLRNDRWIRPRPGGENGP